MTMFSNIFLLVFFSLVNLGQGSQRPVRSREEVKTPTRSNPYRSDRLDRDRVMGSSSRSRNDIDATYSDEEDEEFLKFSSSKSALSGGRMACGFYLWDFPSAFFHKWCHHLMKDCVIEGRGGRKFVRVQPGSMLQLLYPCSRYSPDRCLICGGNFRDHLTLWWAKNLYTPYDRFLDKFQEEHTVKAEDSIVVESKAGQKKGKKIETVFAIGEEKKREYAFHKQYVLEKSLFQKESGKKQKGKQLEKNALETELEKRGIPPDQTFEIVTLKSRGFTYVVPAAVQESGKAPSITLQFARALLLKAVDSLIYLEATGDGNENEMD